MSAIWKVQRDDMHSCSTSSGDTGVKVASYSCYYTLLLSVTQHLWVGTNLPGRVATVTLLKLLLCCTKLCTLQDIPKGSSNTF